MKGSLKSGVDLARRGPEMPSYLLGYDELDPATFHKLGLVTRRAPDGSPRFNLHQTVWFEPDEHMDWTEEPTAAVFALAVNVLTPFASRLDVRAYFGATSRAVLKAAPAFAEAWLLTMPDFGGRIPIEILRKYIR